ncbi:MAG: hypothetical protein ACUVRV_09385 [Cyanobacteriota bacterium]
MRRLPQLYRLGNASRGSRCWLMALNLLEGFDLSRIPYQAGERYHLQIEVMKLAFADAG